MGDVQDDHALTLIERTLASAGMFIRLPPQLLTAYGASQDALYRRANRISLAGLTLVFDAFLLAQFRSAPELVPLSALLRLGLFSPCALVFLILDRRGLPRPWYPILLSGLAVAPTLISAVLCLRTTSGHSLSDVHATTLIMLTVGLILRQEMVAVFAVVLLSFVTFSAAVLLAPIIPPEEIPSLLLTDFAIATSVFGCSMLLCRRDRLLFLLMYREDIRGRRLAAQNVGLREAVELDALTSIANRRCFDRRLAEAWQGCLAARHPLSLIMIDIDNFKRFNDHYGHQGGDDCLRRVARTAVQEMRIGDLIARYGGEEFTVILPDTPFHIAIAAAERIRLAIEGLGLPHEGLAPSGRVTISLGVGSVVPTQETCLTHLIELADRNLYNAKRDGRNRVNASDILWAREIVREQVRVAR